MLRARWCRTARSSTVVAFLIATIIYRRVQVRMRRMGRRLTCISCWGPMPSCAPDVLYRCGTIVTATLWIERCQR